MKSEYKTGHHTHLSQLGYASLLNSDEQTPWRSQNHKHVRFPCFTGTFQRNNDFNTVQTVYSIPSL